MAYHLDDTIAAIASASGVAARGIIRLSGPTVPEILERCFQASLLDSLPTPGPRAIAGELSLEGALQLPVVVHFWPDKRSYTRQISAEIHTTASPALLRGALETLCASGARLAEPGEFTLRAFLGGRLDLTQAEAVLGVVDARGVQELDTALAQLAGGLTRPLGQLRDSLLDTLAHLEAGLDFAEEDIEFVTRSQIAAALQDARRQICELLARISGRAELGESLRAVLVGAPNVGKSSLFNALTAGSALVSPVAGTTRDYLTAQLDLGGLSCELVDTAGVQSVSDFGAIEAAAQQLGAEQHRGAHLQVLCLDATRAIDHREHEILSRAERGGLIVAWTKCDAAEARAKRQCAEAVIAVDTSAKCKTGLDRLQQVMASRLAACVLPECGVVAGTAARCRASLGSAALALGRADELNACAGGEELLAAELRSALAELGAVVGAVYSDDILDRVFSRFCIGK